MKLEPTLIITKKLMSVNFKTYDSPFCSRINALSLSLKGFVGHLSLSHPQEKEVHFCVSDNFRVILGDRKADEQALRNSHEVVALHTMDGFMQPSEEEDEKKLRRQQSH